MAATGRKPKEFMRVDLFDFDLPESSIALRPVEPRDAARMLVVRPQTPALEDRSVRDLPDLLQPGDVLVLNDTKVIPVAAPRRSRARGNGRQGRDHAAQAREPPTAGAPSRDRRKSSRSATASASAKLPRARRASWCASMPK